MIDFALKYTYHNCLSYCLLYLSLRLSICVSFFLPFFFLCLSVFSSSFFSSHFFFYSSFFFPLHKDDTVLMTWPENPVTSSTSSSLLPSSLFSLCFLIFLSPPKKASPLNLHICGMQINPSGCALLRLSLGSSSHLYALRSHFTSLLSHFGSRCNPYTPVSA